MKQTYTLEEVRNLAVGAYSEGYCDVFEKDTEDIPELETVDEIDELICRYIDAKGTK